MATVAAVSIDPIMCPLCMTREPGLNLFNASHALPNSNGEYQSMPMSMCAAILTMRAVGLIVKKGIVNIKVPVADSLSLNTFECGVG